MYRRILPSSRPKGTSKLYNYLFQTITHCPRGPGQPRTPRLLTTYYALHPHREPLVRSFSSSFCVPSSNVTKKKKKKRKKRKHCTGINISRRSTRITIPSVAPKLKSISSKEPRPADDRCSRRVRPSKYFSRQLCALRSVCR